MNLRPGTVIVNDVPAGVCDLCSEIFLTIEVAKSIERLTRSAKMRRVQLEIVGFGNAELAELVQ